jgi:hypothetical protein
MNLEARIETFSLLGETLRDLLNGKSAGKQERFDSIIEHQQTINPWFTPDNVRFALTSIANELTSENLIRWTDAYPQLREKNSTKIVGVIMAGNIPLVGFHDFLCVLMTGNKVLVKTSSKDSELIKFIRDIICSINKDFFDMIEFAESTLLKFDIVIASGSNNSSRYFESYFGLYPNIIRRNRNSIAVLDGKETETELEELGRDIFSYFGLGCRNVSKIYLPEGYDISSLSTYWESYSNIIKHQKYSNNYDFNKAVYIVNKSGFYDSGFMLMTKNSEISSPVSVLYYEYYKTQNSVQNMIKIAGDKIQTVVSRETIPFGEAQLPRLWDYADDIDTIDFLLKKNNT